MNEFFTEIDNNGNELIFKRDGEMVWCIPVDSGNSDYQAYLNKDNPDWGKGTIS